MIWEYWEGDGEYKESFKIALPDPIIVNNITQEELIEVITRINLIQLPEY